MELTDEQIETFQNLFEKRFGVRLKKQEAMKYGLELTSLMQAIYSPMKLLDLEKLPNLYEPTTSRPTDSNPKL